MQRILFLEAHQVVRRGLQYFIDCRLGATVYGEASTVIDALILAREQSWDMVVLGSLSDEQSVLEALKDLKQIQPSLPILVLSTHPNVENAIRAYQAGAAGYITKDSPRDELVKAVANVCDGRGYVAAAIAEGLAADLQGASRESYHQHLSYRELELVCLIASGKTLGEIAGQLGLSDKTVQTYRARVLDKMRMKNNAEIIRYAVLNHLGELPVLDSQRTA